MITGWRNCWRGDSFQGDRRLDLRALAGRNTSRLFCVNEDEIRGWESGTWMILSFLYSGKDGLVARCLRGAGCAGLIRDVEGFSGRGLSKLVTA